MRSCSLLSVRFGRRHTPSRCVIASRRWRLIVAAESARRSSRNRLQTGPSHVFDLADLAGSKSFRVKFDPQAGAA